DTTIVSMAMPAIMGALHADLTAIIWVNSAYLLTFAVPLLITGRLGDRFGPRNIYLIGLVLFTGASAWCGLSPSIGSLIAARAVQGFGAAMMSPQSMTMITRLFPY
ncbi:MFS transporter, partial [Glutamicibacter creatinolyticus]